MLQWNQINKGLHYLVFQCILLHSDFIVVKEKNKTNASWKQQTFYLNLLHNEDIL